MIKITDRQKIAKIIGDRLMAITVVEACCGYALETSFSSETIGDEIEVDGLRFSVNAETQKIAPEISVEVGGEPEGIMVKNMAAKSYCGCGRSFTV